MFTSEEDGLPGVVVAIERHQVTGGSVLSNLFPELSSAGNFEREGEEEE